MTRNLALPQHHSSTIRGNTTVVRIPLRSAKHHFGVSVSRGTRPYNEDAYQAGVIDLPAFAKRAPVTLSRAPANSPLQAYREAQRKQQEEAEGLSGDGEAKGAEGESGDPQVFYFGVFDGHGGAKCSGYLRETLHGGIEEAAKNFGLKSSLGPKPNQPQPDSPSPQSSPDPATTPTNSTTQPPSYTNLIPHLLKSYKETIGGYFRRFTPTELTHPPTPPTLPTILTYAFLQTDLHFLHAQLRLLQPPTTSPEDDRPINDLDSRHNSPNNPPSSTPQTPTAPFRGGSTASIALISTPTPTPFWHPSTPSTIYTAHVGDTRILLSRVSDGAAIPMTTDHHPSTPSETTRLRRWATSLVTDSFGESRLSGLANTRAFGDMASKRMGVSAEPEIRSLELKASEYAFLVMVSDGVSGVCSDQEIVDVVKEARTPELGARELVAFCGEVGGGDGGGECDNATALVVRLGGWERRGEGGGGGMGTREERGWRRGEAGGRRMT